MDLPLVALRSLSEVARRGTMSAAAEALGYSPAAVSLHVNALTRAVGRQVVVQAGRRTRLTDAGKAVLGHAIRLADSEARLARQLRQIGTELTGTVSVGCFGSGAPLVAEAAALVRQNHPGLQIHVRDLREVGSDNPRLSVARLEVDIDLDLDYPHSPVERSKNLSIRLMASETLRVLGLTGDETTEAVGLGTPSGLDWIMPPDSSQYGRASRVACRSAGFEPRVRHEVTDMAMAIRLVEGGLGITFATPLMVDLANSGLHVWRPLEEAFTREIIAVMRDGEEPRQAVEAFVAALRVVLQQRGLRSPG